MRTMKIYVPVATLLQDGHPFKENLGVFSSKAKSLDCVKSRFRSLYYSERNYNASVDGFDLSFDRHAGYGLSDYHCSYYFDIHIFTLNGIFLDSLSVNLSAILNNEKTS